MFPSVFALAAESVAEDKTAIIYDSNTKNIFGRNSDKYNFSLLQQFPQF